MKHTDIDLDRNEFTDFISKKGMKGLMKGISKHLGECKKEYDDTTKMLKASRMMARRQSLKDFMKSCMESKKKKAPPKPKGEGRSGVVHRRPIIKKRPKYMQGKPKNPNVDIEKEVIDKYLNKFKNNRRKTANALNISERTLYRKLKEYDLK